MNEDEFRYKDLRNHPAAGLEFENMHPVDSIIAERDALREALGFYAEVNNWTGWEYEDDMGATIRVDPPVGDDCGERAKQALNRIQKIKKGQNDE